MEVFLAKGEAGIQKTQNHKLQIAILYPVFLPKFVTLTQIGDFPYPNTKITSHGVPHAHFAQIANRISQIPRSKNVIHFV